MLALTNDGLTGFRRVGRQRRARGSCPISPSRCPPRPTAAGRTASSCARASATRPARSCGRRTSAGRSSARSISRARTGAYYAAHRRGAAVPGRAEEAVRPLAGDRGRRRLEHRHVPPHRARPRLPLRARAPVGLRRARRDAAPSAPASLPATGPYRIASFDPKRGVRLVRNPRFREWSPAAQPSGFPDVIVERFGGSPDAHVAAVLRGSADLASRRRPAPRRPCSRRVQDAAREPARGQPVGQHVVPRPQHPGRAVRRRAGPPGVEPRRRPGAADATSPSARASAR